MKSMHFGGKVGYKKLVQINEEGTESDEQGSGSGRER